MKNKLEKHHYRKLLVIKICFNILVEIYCAGEIKFIKHILLIIEIPLLFHINKIIHVQPGISTSNIYF